METLFMDERLVPRSEEALLGALLYDPSLVAEIPQLLPRHFSDSYRAEVFAAITDVHTALPDMRGAEFTRLVAHQVDTPPWETELDGWALSSNPSSAAAYGRLVHEAAVRRELIGHAERLAELAGPDRGVDPSLDHLADLASALRLHAADGEATVAHYLPIYDTEQQLRALQEDQILADLIQHPDLVPEVAGWLDPAVFTAPHRRQVFEAIISVELYGDPVEELTITWEIHRERALTAYLHPEPDGPAGPQTVVDPPPGYVARLAATSVETGTAVIAGHALFTQHVQAELGAAADGLAQQPGAEYILGHRLTPIPARTAGVQAAPLLEPPRHLAEPERQLRQEGGQ